MATYKLIQDIEAEDKILGPLTLRQFIFALIAVFFIYLDFLFLTKGVYFLLILSVPPTIFFGFFALPLGRDQPTEIWALAKLRYFFKPRKRIWNQSGVKELVTITVPKKIEKVYSDGLSQMEVQSRLKALASTIDSRGWAVKNVNLNSYAVPTPMAPSTDRLIGTEEIPQAVPDSDIVPSDDIMDARHNPIAQQFNNMLTESSQNIRNQAVQQMNGQSPAQTSTQNNYWFMNNASSQMPIQTAPAAANIDPAEEKAILDQIKAKSSTSAAPVSHLRTLKPTQSTVPPPIQPTPATPQPAMTASPDPAILSLAENDDLNVSTLAREAKRAKGEKDDSQDEVVVSLH